MHGKTCDIKPLHNFKLLGKRRFLATDLSKFWSFYQKEDPSSRHYYELIQEGLPCRLYFDLEYQKECNPHVDSAKMLAEFMDLCRVLLYEIFNLEVDPAKHFLILDSTTPKKFSAHMIVHLPDGRLFPSNTSLKPFIQLLCNRMEKDRVGIVKKEDGKETFLCDAAVYSKNRNFRLFLSSKCGKTAVLRLADYCTFYGMVFSLAADPERTIEHIELNCFLGSKKPVDLEIFLDSLVVPYKHNDYEIISIENIPQIRQAMAVRGKNPILLDTWLSGKFYKASDQF